MNDQNSNEELKATWKSTVEFLKLYVENFRLLSTEKMTILMSKGALAGIVAMLALIAFFFISMGLVYLLGEVLPIMWAFIIMGGGIYPPCHFGSSVPSAALCRPYSPLPFEAVS